MDYYCPTKFTDLQVHVQSRLLYNCCQAYPERVDLGWLEANPGRLFHTNTMLEDRKLMLDNKSCHSCYHGCYKLEEQGLTSIRQTNNTGSNNSQKKIIDLYSPMIDLTLILTTDCNLACVYCSPEFSTSWQREVQQNGKYVVGDHEISNDNWSNLWVKIKQKSRGLDSKFFRLLLNEIKLARGLKRINLMGGEPLLNNQLEQVLEHCGNKEINIITGLGVSDERLKRTLEVTKNHNVNFNISAEATGDHFNFIRHGLTWDDFTRRVNIIEQTTKKIKFLSTMSNLSVFDFHNFYQYYGGKYKIVMSTMSGRPFLRPHVLDDRSKQEYHKVLPLLGDNAETMLKMVDPETREQDRVDLGSYLKQLSIRRSLKLDFLPKHFLDWCGADA